MSSSGAGLAVVKSILDIVWGMDFDVYDRAVDTHIKKLCKALGKASYHIETVI